MNIQRARRATPDDQYLGERVREARLSLGMTQTELAELLGVSYQQVQKYESGGSRISGARVGLLVSALRRPVEFFFPNLTEIRRNPATSSFISTKTGQFLAERFPLLATKQQQAIVNLIDVLTTERPR